MSRFFRKNLDRSSRQARGVCGALVLIAGIFVAEANRPFGVALIALGAFAVFEALTGWCIVRRFRAKF